MAYITVTIQTGHAVAFYEEEKEEDLVGCAT